MSMSRKDFVLLANAIKEIRDVDCEDDFVVDKFAQRIADAINGHCATFDKQRFLKACGVETKK